MVSKLFFSLLVIALTITPGSIFAQAPMKLDFSLGTEGEVKVGNRLITSHTLAALKGVKSELEKRMGGKVEVVIHPGGTLGNVTESMEQTKLGVIAGAGMTSAYLGKFAPETQVLGLPYIFPSLLVAQDVLTGPFGQELWDLVAKKAGFRVLIAYPGGFRNFGNKVRPIHSASDMQGLKIRTIPNPVHMKMVKALGARPTPVDWHEVYTSVQTGVVDGMEGAPTAFLSQNWHEVVKNYTLDGHFVMISMVVIGEAWYQKQSKELQMALIEAGKIGSISGLGVHVMNEPIVLDELKRLGVKIYAPTLKEKESYRKATQSEVVGYLREKVGSEWVDKILKAVDASRAKYGY